MAFLYTHTDPACRHLTLARAQASSFYPNFFHLDKKKIFLTEQHTTIKRSGCKGNYILFKHLQPKERQLEKGVENTISGLSSNSKIIIRQSISIDYEIH